MSRTAASLVAATLLVTATLVSVPAGAQGGDPTVYGLGFAGPPGGSVTTASEGTGTLTVPADGPAMTANPSPMPARSSSR